MTQLIVSALPFAVALVGFVVAVCATAVLAVDLVLHWNDHKKHPRPCEARVRDPRGGPREYR